MNCPKCASNGTVEERSVPPHLGLYCGSCGAWLKWLPQPVTAQRALAYSLGFGKHSGVPFSEVPVDYLQWLSTSPLAPKVKQMAEAALTARASEDYKSHE